MDSGITLRYSEAFKAYVVGEIESGKMNVFQAQKRYGINGGATISSWMRRLGKNHLMNKVVRVESPAERDRLKVLEQEKRQLESALAQTQLKVLALEKLIEVAEEHYRIDIKKNSGGKPSDDSEASLA